MSDVASVEALLESDTAIPLRIKLAGAVWDRLLAWARATDDEVSGMALIDVDDADLRVSEAFLLPQRSNRVETQLEPGGLATLLQELVSHGTDPGRLRLWWHSHARETVFWSGLDERTIDDLGPAPFISFVLDHAGRRLARLDQFKPRRTHLLEIVIDESDASSAIQETTAGDDIGRAVGRLAPGPALCVGGAH